jgi:Putative intracellular protease/amidase
MIKGRKVLRLHLPRRMGPISAGIIKGRRATSVGAIRDDMVNAGADWLDEATVVDGNLISARTPADLGPWMKAFLAALNTE